MNIEKKIWGKSIEIHNDGISITRILEIQKGGTCSWHYHVHRHNAFYVISGLIRIKWSPSPNSLERHELTMKAGSTILLIMAGEAHQFTALENSVIVEIDYADMTCNDITRLSDGFVDRKIANSGRKRRGNNRT